MNWKYSRFTPWFRWGCPTSSDPFLSGGEHRCLSFDAPHTSLAYPRDRRYLILSESGLSENLNFVPLEHIQHSSPRRVKYPRQWSLPARLLSRRTGQNFRNPQGHRTAFRRPAYSSRTASVSSLDGPFTTISSNSAPVCRSSAGTRRRRYADRSQVITITEAFMQPCPRSLCQTRGPTMPCPGRDHAVATNSISGQPPFMRSSAVAVAVAKLALRSTDSRRAGVYIAKWSSPS